MTTSDAALCARVTCARARTFAFASRFLPGDKRRAAFAVYAFCRIADDLADDTARSLHEVEDALDTYSRRLTEALAGRPSDPIFRELAWAVARYAIPEAPLYELVGAVSRDLAPRAYRDWAALAEYCRGVASTVGEICAHVFGVPDAEQERARAVGYARTLGVAMQLTNILRDVGEDAARGRCYLPEEDLTAFSLRRDEILTGHLRVVDARWRALMTFEVRRARALYEAASPGLAMVATDAQRCAVLCATGYAAILGAIERNGYNTLTRRARAGRLVRASLLWDAWRATRRPQALSGPAQTRAGSHRTRDTVASPRGWRTGDVLGWAESLRIWR